MKSLLTVLLLTFTLPATAAEKYWNQFRGPNGDGKSSATGVPAELGDGKNVVWKTKIHGKGWSSPVVWENQIWMQTATLDGKDLYALCVDAKTGKIVHDIRVFHVDSPKFCHPTNSYASCTPYVEKGRVYVHFGAYGTACLDTESGKTIWQRRDFVSDDFRGPASSPIVHDGKLFVNFDGVDFQFVVALDKTTGKTVWRKKRTIDYGTNNGDRKKAYGTPTIIKVNGREQLVSPAAVETISYDPKDGSELWRIRHGGMNVGARPLFAHGMVYISAGSRDKSLVAVKPDGKGDVTSTHIVWGKGRSVPKRASQIIVGDLFFMMADNGAASCLNAKTGEVYWTKRIQGAYWASPVYADGKIYCFSKEGKVPVFKAARKFELLATNQFDSGFNASPAFIGNAMILRTFTHLYRIEKRD